MKGEPMIVRTVEGFDCPRPTTLYYESEIIILLERLNILYGRGKITEVNFISNTEGFTVNKLQYGFDVVTFHIHNNYIHYRSNKRRVHQINKVEEETHGEL